MKRDYLQFLQEQSVAQAAEVAEILGTGSPSGLVGSTYLASLEIHPCLCLSQDCKQKNKKKERDRIKLKHILLTNFTNQNYTHQWPLTPKLTRNKTVRQTSQARKVFYSVTKHR